MIITARRGIPGVTVLKVGMSRRCLLQAEFSLATKVKEKRNMRHRDEYFSHVPRIVDGSRCSNVKTFGQRGKVSSCATRFYLYLWPPLSAINANRWPTEKWRWRDGRFSEATLRCVSKAMMGGEIKNERTLSLFMHQVLFDFSSSV